MTKYCTCQVITSLPPPEEGRNLSFYTLDEQLDLLGKVRISVPIGWISWWLLLTVCRCPIHHYRQVLNAGDDMIGVEHLEEDSDGKALLKARRSAGSMSALSGAGGRIYLEYRCCLSTFPLFFYNKNCSVFNLFFLTECTCTWPVLPALRGRVLRRNQRTHRRGIICLRNATSRIGRKAVSPVMLCLKMIWLPVGWHRF